VENPPRWKPAVLQKISVPFGATKAWAAEAGMRASSSSSVG
jgi:hypothetical protein